MHTHTAHTHAHTQYFCEHTSRFIKFPGHNDENITVPASAVGNLQETAGAIITTPSNSLEARPRVSLALGVLQDLSRLVTGSPHLAFSPLLPTWPHCPFYLALPASIKAS